MKRIDGEKNRERNKVNIQYLPQQFLPAQGKNNVPSEEREI
jgi:hypothetical protein